MDREYSKRQLRDIYVLATRARTRGENTDQALLLVEQHAELRAAGKVHSGDRKLDRRIAKLAKHIRKQHADDVRKPKEPQLAQSSFAWDLDDTPST